MLVKNIEYTDFNGEKTSEEWAFHLNEAELIKWVAPNDDTALDKLIVQMAKEQKGKDLLGLFDELILSSVGKISANGKRFIKDEETVKDFKSSPAYSELFMELVSDAEKAAAFLNGIVPADFGAKVDKFLSDNQAGIPDELKDYLPKK